MRKTMALLMLFLLAGCEASVGFTVTETAETTVERCPLGVTFLNALGFTQFDDLNITDTREFQNQGVEPADVDSVRLQSLTFRVTTPGGSDLSYLDRVAFFAEAPGQPRVLVAERRGFPAGQSTVEFDTLDVELKPYVTAERMQLTTDIESNGCPSSDQQLQATAVFDVNATARGVGRYLGQQ